MNLPATLRNRAVFGFSGAALGGLYAAYEVMWGGVYPADQMPLAMGAVLGGGLCAIAVWPTGLRGGWKMAFLGCLLAFIAIWASQFAIGFFSEREVQARAQGLNVWVGSFFGSLLIGLFLSFFVLLKTLLLPLLFSGFVTSLFRDAQ